MASIIIFLLKSMLTFALLYSLYRLLLKKETFHWLNRIVLLVVLVASIVLPLVNIPTSRPGVIAQKMLILETEITDEISPNVSEDYVIASSEPSVVATVVRWAGYAYLAVAALLMLQYLVSLVSLWVVIARSKRVHDGSANGRVSTLYNPDVPTPCSWMRWIIVNITPASADYDLVLKHEASHVRLGHSLDMMLCELVVRALWILPFGWLLRRDLRDVHEYQADAYVIRSTSADERYCNLIIRHAISGSSLSAANALGDSSIKGRLKMIFRRKSSRIALTKAAYVLPILLFTCMAFAKPDFVTAVVHVVDTAYSTNPDRTEFGEKPEVVKHIETARCTLREYVDMPCKYQIETSDSATRITYLRLVSSRDEIIAVKAGNLCIYDEATGDRYICRGIEGYGDHVNINLKSYPNTVVPFTLVFPPLKSGVKKIRLL